MVVFEFLGHIVTSILIGYLAFTNMLAERIEMYLPAPTEETVPASDLDEEIQFESEGDLSNQIIEYAPKTATGSRISIPKVLLENKEFQRAAVIASEESEEHAPDSEELIEDSIKNALVNIYCQYRTDRYIRTTTGTGFFISRKGVILTNAHVAQYLLLEDSKSAIANVDCVIRTGDPAVPRYKAELLYISPTWILENASLITEESPRGTGERDYALLYVSKSLDSSPLPARFPSIPISTTLLSRGVERKTVITAGYPAEALFRNGSDAELLPVVASTTVGSLYTFGSNYADIFSISESPVGEQGASGGPIMEPDERSVIGLIVTKGDTEIEGEHSLRALTLSYINRTIIEETGFSIGSNTQGDLALRGAIFKRAMLPFLAGLLEDEINAGE